MNASDDPDAARSRPSRDSGSFLGLVLASEAGLAALAFALARWSGVSWRPMLQATQADVWLGVLAGLGLVVVHLCLLLPGGKRNPLYRTIYEPLRTALRPPLRRASFADLFLIGVASSVGEELFFRGWLQSEAGIVVASLLFGAAHVWGRDAIPYGLYATAMGFVLGGLFAYTEQGLWAPILAHFVNNLVGLVALAYGWLPEPPA